MSENKMDTPRWVYQTDTRHEYVMETELCDTQTPRAVRYSKGYLWKRRFAWNILILIIGLFGFFWRRDYETWNALIDHGTVRQATVTDKFKKTGKNKSFTLYYRFPTEGGDIDSKVKVSREQYNSTPVGGKLTITYLAAADSGLLPSKWQVGEISASRRNIQTLKWLGWCVLIAGGWGLYLAHVMATGEEEQKVLRGWTPTRGTILSGEVIDGKQKTYRIHYNYTVANSTYGYFVEVGKDEYHSLLNGNPYKTVLYDPSEERSNKLYFTIRDACLLATTID